MGRKSISKKTRFEIFKRDGFTCQYCGRMSPDVVLEVDHIIPVSDGGTDDFLNLITSCFDCNRGKGKRKLSDKDEVKKQQEQLKLLNEKRQQFKMLLEWKKELESFEDEQVNEVEKVLSTVLRRRLNEYGRELFKKNIKKFGFEEVYESAKISLSQYYVDGSNENAEEIINYVFKICANRKYQKENPMVVKVNYLMKIAKNNFGYLREYDLKKLLLNNLEEGDFETVKEIMLDAKNWTVLWNDLNYYFYGGEEEE